MDPLHLRRLARSQRLRGSRFGGSWVGSLGHHDRGGHDVIPFNTTLVDVYGVRPESPVDPDGAGYPGSAAVPVPVKLNTSPIRATITKATGRGLAHASRAGHSTEAEFVLRMDRSEERRVGEEGRAR